MTLNDGLAILSVIACHEAGHAAAALALGYRVRPFARIYAAGIAVVVPDTGLPPAHDLTIALAGPAASFALTAATMTSQPVLAGLSAIVGLLNLVPLPGSDGMRAWRACRALLSTDGASGETVCTTCLRGREACEWCEKVSEQDWRAMCDCGLHDFDAHLTDCQERAAFRYVIACDYDSAELKR